MARPRDELPYVEFKPKSGGTERIYADAWMSEDFSAPATVTEHAVESGAIVSDHYLILPCTARVELLFSGSPIRGDLDDRYPGTVKPVTLNIPDYPEFSGGLRIGDATKSLLGAVGLGKPKEEVPRETSVLTFDRDPRGRLREVLETLMQLRQDRILITLGMSVLVAKDLAITELRIGRTEKDGDSGTIILDVKQIQFTQSETAEPVPLPVEPRAQKKGNNSAASGAPVPAGPTKTAAKSLADSLRGQ